MTTLCYLAIMSPPAALRVVLMATNTASPRWFPSLSEVNHSAIDKQRYYLEWADSLTVFLRERTQDTISFVHHTIDKLAIAASDASYLQQPSGVDGLRRVILWSHQHQLWVYAESIIPLTTAAYLPDAGQGLAPLGEVLFGEPKNPCSTLEFATLSAEHGLYQRACAQYQGAPNPATLIARRRRFMITEQHPLMIVEVFFEECLQH